MDPESRLVLAVVPGARDAECVEAVVAEVKNRTGGRMLDLMTSDAYPAYETAILEAYGQEVTTTATGRESRKMVPEKVPPPGLNYGHRGEASGEGARGGDPHVDRLWHDGGRHGGVGPVEGESLDQHRVSGASERDGPAPQRTKSPQDVHVFEGLACSRVDDVLHDVQ